MTGDLEELDSRYDYYFRLYGNGKAPYTEVRLRAALGYLRWQREAVRLKMDESRSARLLDMYHLNEELLVGVAGDSTVESRWYQELVLSQLRNMYLLEDRFAPTVDNKGLTAYTPLFNSNFDEEDFNAKRLEMMQRNSLSRGAELLQGLIDSTTDVGDSTELARLHLELGDWYQWHGKARRAGAQYERVVQLLEAQNQSDLLQQWLGQPVELPDNGAFWQPRPDVEGSTPVVSVRYDVSARGRATNMEAQLSSSEDRGLASRLKRKLGQIRFRPRWISGAAEPALAVQRDYQLLD